MVDVADLTACGLSADAIATRVANGRLFRVYRGVYGVIPNLTLEGQFLAAVKACGPDAVLSHFSAAVLYGWFDWDGRFPEVTVTNPRKHQGIFSHRSGDIERTIFKGIPVAPPARVIRDLAGKLPYVGVRRAVNEALNRGQIKPVDLVTARHRGACKLRKILLTAAPTRNEYEDLVNELLHRAGIGAPEVNRRRRRLRAGLPLARAARDPRGRQRALPRPPRGPRQRPGTSGRAGGSRRDRGPNDVEGGRDRARDDGRAGARGAREQSYSG